MGHYVGQSKLKYVVKLESKKNSSSPSYFHLQTLIPFLAKMALDDKLMNFIVTANWTVANVRGQAGQDAPPSDEEMQVRHLS